MKKQVLSVILLASIILASCGGEPTQPETTTEPTETTETTVEDTTLPPPEVRDFGGKEFNIYIRYATDGWDWNVNDFAVDEQNGEPVNDAVWKRNGIISERYNCTITQTKSNDMWGSGAARNSILAGDKAYDAVILPSQITTSLGMEGLMYDLMAFDELNLDRSYWNPTLIDKLTIGGKLYNAMGDLSATDNRSVRCLYFNKELFDKYKLDDPYALVKSGEWTIDRFLKMVTDGKVDLDGNGEFDENDQLGLYVQPTIGQNMFYASNGQFVTKDNNDMLQVAFGNQNLIDLMSSISDKIATASDAMYISNDYQNMIPSFAEGHSLFYSEVSLFIERFRQYDFEVGMLPMPKYDEAQKNYCQYSDGACLNLVGIPIDSETPEDTALLLEAMSAESPETLTKAYYDVCLTGKSIRDEESADMLDIIFGNYTIDYADILSLSAFGKLSAALRGESEVASTVAAALESAKNEIAKINEKLAK